MAAAPTFPPERDSAHGTVTVFFVTGQTKSGQIDGFSRYLGEIVVQNTVHFGVGGDQVLETRILVKHIAYIAFHADGETPVVAPPNRTKSLRVHLTTGPEVEVFADPADTANPIGFYGTPSDPKSPFQEMFFYEHGVRGRESTDGIGGLLMRAGKAFRRRPAEGAAAPVAAAAPPRKRIGELLIEANLATPRDIELALEVQKRDGRKLGEILVDLGVLSEVDLALALSHHPDAMFEVPLELLRAHARARTSLHARPDTDGSSSDRPAEMALPSIDVFSTGGPSPVSIAMRHSSGAASIGAAARNTARSAAGAPRAEPPPETEEIEQILKQLQNDEVSPAAVDESEGDLTNSSDSAVIRLANRIILDGYRRGASDIHIEPNGRERPTQIRFRIDGECVTYQEIPPTLRAPLVARLKIMARLDISERRKPQDGKIQLRIKDKKVELRVATLPTVADNEDVVLRILAASKPLPLGEMGLSPRNLRELGELMKKPYGLVLCVGPTGSGKTTTLHSALGSINTVDMKIWTAEDPVEITQEGLRQVQVNSKIGFTFAAAMRAFLRADPDVIMVGEMRDKETAGTAVEASLTGHLVLSTLHTNSAPETITRLLDMGLDPFSFADALLGVLAQRLTRKLCQSCRTQYTASQDEQRQLEMAYGQEALAVEFGLAPGQHLPLWHAPGCSDCSQSGYKGRIAIHELLVTDDAMRGVVARRPPIDELRTMAMKGGMHTLVQDGIEKAVAGLTDLKQVFGACSK
jgi:type II secretory ATPase GspE/PulE/Tfp pilus assembly ATPase PilB-like protein